MGGRQMSGRRGAAVGAAVGTAVVMMAGCLALTAGRAAAAGTPAPGALDASFGSGGTVQQTGANEATGVAVIPAGLTQAGDVVTSSWAGSPASPSFQVDDFTPAGALRWQNGYVTGKALAVTVVPRGLTNQGRIVAAGYDYRKLCGASAPVQLPAVEEVSPTGGAVAEGFAGARTVPGVAVSTSTTTITASSASFTQSDVGAVVCGPGLSGGTTISAVNDSTHATITRTPTASSGGESIGVFYTGQLDAVTIDSAGRIVAAGAAFGPAGNFQTLVARFTTAVAADPTFGTSGGFTPAVLGSVSSLAAGVAMVTGGSTARDRATAASSPVGSTR